MSADNCILVVTLNGGSAVVFDNVSVSHLGWATVEDWEGNTLISKGAMYDLHNPEFYEDATVDALRTRVRKLEDAGYYEYGVREAYGNFNLEDVYPKSG